VSCELKMNKVPKEVWREVLLGSGLRVGMRRGSERGKVGSRVDFYDPATGHTN